MKFMGTGGMKAGIKTKENQGTFTFLSQAVDKNNTYRICFPVIKKTGSYKEDGTFVPSPEPGFDDEFDIQAITLPGYKTDLDKMGTTFFPLNDYDINEVGKVIDNGILPTYARISKILFDAEYRRECSNKEAQVAKDAADMGQQVDPVTLNTSLKEIEQAYYGAKINGQNVAPSKQQAVNPLRVCIFTAGVIWKLEGETKPSLNEDTIGFSLELNGTKATQLKTAITKAMAERKDMMEAIARKKMMGNTPTPEEENFRHMLDQGYLEVEYVYHGTSKQEAGRSAAFTYCGMESDATCKKFPDYWSKKKDEIIGKLIYDMDTMAAKNRNLSMAPTEDKVRMNFLKYCSENAVLGSYINFEGEEADAVKRAAADMLAIDGFKNNASFYQKLKDAYEEGLSEPASGVEEDEEESAASKAVSGILEEQKFNDRASLMDVLQAAGGEDGLNAAAMAFSDPASL